jgi:hypothetical protein
MQSDAIDVDSYLTQVPQGRRAVLTEIRDACRRLLAGFERAFPRRRLVEFLHKGFRGNYVTDATAGVEVIWRARPCRAGPA